MQRIVRSARHRARVTTRVLATAPELSTLRLALGGAIAVTGLAHAVTALMHTVG